MAFRPLLIGALMLSCIGTATAANPSRPNSGAITYRWVDEKGVVHYGDSVPPKYSQQETSVLNSQGVEVAKHAAQKTPAELAEEARQHQEVMRQKQRDSFLLTTYTSVKDIEDLRDLRLDQIKGQRVAAEQYVAGLHDRLLALQARAVRFKPYSDNKSARRMPDDLADEMVRALNEMRTQQNLLASKDAEESTMRAQFQSDIDRYKELRTPRTAIR